MQMTDYVEEVLRSSNESDFKKTMSESENRPSAYYLIQ